MARANSFSHIGNQAINILARLSAKNHIKQQLRDQGVRLSLVPPRVISEQAQRYLADHAEELYRDAKERAVRMGLIPPMVTPDRNS